MCGRYLFAKKPKEIYKRYNIPKQEQLGTNPMYNIYPGARVPVITRNSPNKVEIMKWGLIPSWSKDPKIGNKLINARGETVHQKPSFRISFKNKRCLIPATGFYEWGTIKDENSSSKIPYLIQLKTRSIFSFAGIYDIWKDAEGKEFKTFSIITTSANKLMEPIHHRMPVILEKENEDTWLDSSSQPEKLLKLLVPFANKGLEYFTVSSKVNSPKNQDKDVITKMEY